MNAVRGLTRFEAEQSPGLEEASLWMGGVEVNAHHSDGSRALDVYRLVVDEDDV